MKSTRIQLVSMALALMLGGAYQANATANTNTLTFSGTIYVQGASTNVGVFEINRVVRTPFSTRSILKMIGTALATNFPDGSTITLEGDVSQNPVFLVRGPNRNVLTNVTSFFTITLGQEVFSGRFNRRTSAETANDIFLVTITFNDGAGNAFEIRGVAVETFHASALQSGHQTITGVGSIAVSGTGTFKGRFCVIKGTVTFRGRSLDQAD